MILYEMSPERITRVIAGGYLLQYAISTAKYQVGRNSKYSQFGRGYKNNSPIYSETWEDDRYPRDIVCEEGYDEEIEAFHDKALDKIVSDAINPYRDLDHFAYLMIENATGKTLREIADDIGCNHVNIHTGIKKYKEYLNKWLRSAS